MQEREATIADLQKQLENKTAADGEACLIQVQEDGVDSSLWCAVLPCL